jgi:hypothetical protein
MEWAVTVLRKKNSKGKRSPSSREGSISKSGTGGIRFHQFSTWFSSFVVQVVRIKKNEQTLVDLVIDADEEQGFLLYAD